MRGLGYVWLRLVTPGYIGWSIEMVQKNEGSKVAKR
jgi:hypothetical protein